MFFISFNYIMFFKLTFVLIFFTFYVLFQVYITIGVQVQRKLLYVVIFQILR
jgi:hypothetical protein